MLRRIDLVGRLEAHFYRPPCDQAQLNLKPSTENRTYAAIFLNGDWALLV